MSRNITNRQIIGTSIVLIPSFLGWILSVELRFSEPRENKEAIKENKSSIKENTLYITKINDKIDKKATSDNANFLLVLGRIYENKILIQDKKDRD